MPYSFRDVIAVPFGICLFIPVNDQIYLAFEDDADLGCMRML